MPDFSDWQSRFLPSIRDHWRSVVLIIAAIACGWIGWSGQVFALPVALLFPALWAHSSSRLTTALVSVGYFMAASRGLPQGVSNFYAADLCLGLLLWLAASTSFVVVHTVAWSRRPGKERVVRYMAAAVLLGLPPLGITGWAHPLTATGVLFPGWGWWGLITAAAGLLVMTTRHWPAATLALGGIWLWSAATWTDPSLPEGWKSIDLEYGQMLGRDRSLDHHRDMIATVRAEADHGSRVFVLPESTLGFWTPTVARLWQNGIRDLDITVIAGAAVLDAYGYDNILVAVSHDQARILYRERMPVPVSMWQPWKSWMGRGDGARAHFFANPVVKLDDVKLAPLICYEQLIVWPVLQSMLFSVDVVVAIGNGWWTRGTSIVPIQRASAAAWTRLFDKPLIIAFNI